MLSKKTKHYQIVMLSSSLDYTIFVPIDTTPAELDSLCRVPLIGWSAAADSDIFPNRVMIRMCQARPRLRLRGLSRRGVGMPPEFCIVRTVNTPCRQAGSLSYPVTGGTPVPLSGGLTFPCLRRLRYRLAGERSTSCRG